MSRINSIDDDVKASVKIRDTLHLSIWRQLENVHTGFAIAQDGNCFKYIRLKSWFFCSIEDVDLKIFFTCCKNVQKTLSNSRLCTHVVNNSEEHYKNNNKKRRKKRKVEEILRTNCCTRHRGSLLTSHNSKWQDGCLACLYLAIPPGIYLAIP